MDKVNGNQNVRIGFYVCHCGTNIAAMVDCVAVQIRRAAPRCGPLARLQYMCSDPGQELIQKDIKEFALNRVVVASCSPLLHEHTFRTAVAAGGLNPFLFHMVNIREHVSWVHTDRKEATARPRRWRVPPSGAWPFTRRSRSSRSRSTPTSWVVGAASPASTPR